VVGKREVHGSSFSTLPKLFMMFHELIRLFYIVFLMIGNVNIFGI
jgi:hypothetical protein